MPNYQPFKTRLDDEKARLARMIDRRQASVSDHGASGVAEAFSNSGDDEFAEQATDVFDKELDVSLLNKYKYRITMIDEALHRFDEGTYGTCTRCKAQISNGRLDAVPETAYCRDCEADVEVQD